MNYKELLEIEINALRAIPLQTIDLFVNCIAQRENYHQTKIITSGIGKAGQIAHTLATTLSSTGTPSVFLHPSEAQHGDLGIACRGDILMVFSNSGKTREVLELIELYKNLYPDNQIISVTGHKDSVIGAKSDLNITYGPVS